MHNGRHAAALVVAAILFACTSGASLPSRGATLPQQAVGSVAWLLTNIKSQEPMYTSLWTRSKELFRQVLEQNTDAVKSAAEELSALRNATGSREPDNATRVCTNQPLPSSRCSFHLSSLGEASQAPGSMVQDCVHCTHLTEILCLMRNLHSICCMTSNSSVLHRLQCTCGMAIRPSGSLGRAQRSAGLLRRKGIGACCAAKRKISAILKTNGSVAIEGTCAASNLYILP